MDYRLDRLEKFSQIQIIETYFKLYETMIKIEMLRCFCLVAQEGNLQTAAQKIGRTPSAVSMMLKQLEEHLGGRLFLTDRKNSLTELGKFALRQSQNEIRHFDATVNALETYASNPEGVLRIASVPSAIYDFLVPALYRFSLAFPRVRVDLRDMDSLSVAQTLSSGQVEIGIASWSVPPDSYSTLPLARDDFGLVCHPAHPLASRKETIFLADLHDNNFVSNNLSKAIANEEIETLNMNSRLAAQNTLSLISILASDNWCTILPSRVVKIDPDGLVFRKIEDLDSKRVLSAGFQDEIRRVPHYNEFLEILQEEAKP